MTENMPKNIIITGTSRGIGFELAQKLADDGHSILALSRNAQPILDLKHANITTFSCDLSASSSLPKMSKDGHVVTISSMGGVQGSMKFPGLAAYSSSKAAVITLTELWAEEFKETGPSFNVLALGAVQTEMLP